MSTPTMQAQAQQIVANNVYQHTLALIEALKDNYREYSIRGHQSAIVSLDRTYGTSEGNHAEYHHRQIDRLKNGDSSIDYVVETGKKYHKVVMIDGGRSRSVHCFVDKKTGEVYKSASWKSPAKGVRYDLRLIADREYLLEHADWSGGYLYLR